MAEQTIIVVVEPSPSTLTTAARMAVPTSTLSGSPLTTRRMKRTSGSNRPITSGTRTREVKGVARLVMISSMKTMTMR